MNILFISSGNSKDGISTITKNQGESLKQIGLEVDYFTIKGKGLIGYLNNLKSLKSKINLGNYDVIHAHYSLSAFLAALSGAKPIVSSLMGSDVKAMPLYRIWIKLFATFFWKVTIVKSQDMKKSLGLKKVYVVPNGVDFKRFKPLNKITCQANLGWDQSKKHILFAANPEIKIKNFKLAKKAIDLLINKKIEVHFLKNIKNEEVLYHYNASDVVLLTSIYEGSPNVIKEAMACNCPIVSTNVGDICQIISRTEGCYITSFDPIEISKKIINAFDYTKTTGRKDITKLRREKIADRLKNIYRKILN